MELVQSNKLSEALLALFTYAQQVPGLMDFLNANKTAAIDAVRDLQKVFKGQPLAAWRDTALERFRALGMQGAEEWQNLLLNLAYEALKGEAKRNWFMRLFVKVKDFLTRNGLNTFVAKYGQDAIDAAVSLLATRNNWTFEEFLSALFKQLRGIFPGSPDTWLAILASLGASFLRARFGVSF